MTAPVRKTSLDQSLPAAGDHREAVSLSPRFLRALRTIENLPANRNGADKSWVQRAFDEARTHFEQARRV